MPILAKLSHIKSNENEFDKANNSGIGGGRIDNKIVNLSSTTKKISFRADFFTSKASLAFTQLRKPFTKTLILHYFNLERHIQIETDTFDYDIRELLS